jgi:hypothetical protein
MDLLIINSHSIFGAWMLPSIKENQPFNLGNITENQDNKSKEYLKLPLLSPIKRFVKNSKDDLQNISKERNIESQQKQQRSKDIQNAGKTHVLYSSSKSKLVTPTMPALQTGLYKAPKEIQPIQPEELSVVEEKIIIPIKKKVEEEMKSCYESQIFSTPVEKDILIRRMNKKLKQPSLLENKLIFDWLSNQGEEIEDS